MSAARTAVSFCSVLGHLSLQQPAQLSDGAGGADSQPVSLSGCTAGSAWAVPADCGDAPAGIGTVVPLGPQQQHDMPPRDVAAGKEKEDDISALLGYLSVDRA